MLNPTYKHLEAALRLGSFSVGQWIQISCAGVLAAVFGVYVSPLSMGATIFVSILVAGLPVAVSYGAMGLEFSVADFAAAAWRYARQPRSYLPGPGPQTAGYRIQAPPQLDDERERAATRLGAEREALWDL